ncbi:hypothetical protein QGN32_05930 [Mycolicibacterium sp. ND9-15]|uniref:hypothetical protein n=1 Tax=Mycolicibacterium sp. ND9-15 TaxID=3042320 RepID=UPI002DD91236|nr:hypothetical protein [Mycolicibacterium sp. ND9-15]WSE58698.1 hypothetical protein QGN32_05930 [Mycolicibacterium sp. ND9-15]
MDIVRGATRFVTNTANATTAAAGAVSGAAINGVIGGVKGTASGIRDGLSSGSHSTPAALLTVGAVGAAGLVEWPVLLTLGGAVLLIRQLGSRNGEQPEPAAVAAKPASTRSTPAKSPGKRAGSAPRKRSAAKK